jgi:DNA-binding transcriptional MocR family regulator
MDNFGHIILEKENGIPLYRQLGDGIRRMIEDGRLAPETKLPPIRQLAKALSVNNMTVVSAYKYLENRKHVYSMVGSGTYVAGLSERVLPLPLLKNEYSASQPVSGDLSQYINFADTATAAALFPVDAFKKAFDAVLDRDGGSAFDYQDSQGYPPLRESLCSLLENVSVKTSPDRIQIISGAQQGLDILAKALLQPGDTLLAESPTFYGAVGAFLSRGAQVAEIPLHTDGPDPVRMEALIKTNRPKAMYLMPNFQTPTGISYSLEIKRQVLELAYKYNVYIIEEDSQNDFYYDNRRRLPLKALDYRNMVIYIKSFSKILMPGLRMGFMVCPRRVNVTAVKRNTDIATSGYIQRAFDLYLRSGGLESHGLQMRAVYGRRYRNTTAAAAYLSPFAGFNPPDGGLSLWFTLKKKMDAEALFSRFLQQKVIVTPGSMFSLQGNDMPCFRVSFAAVPEPGIDEGFRIMASVMDGGG